MKAVAVWARPFDDPVLLPAGRELVTLRDAADYIMKLPVTEQDPEEWQTAIGCLIGAAEGRDFMMHARIGVLRALWDLNSHGTPGMGSGNARRYRRTR